MDNETVPDKNLIGGKIDLVFNEEGRELDPDNCHNLVGRDSSSSHIGRIFEDSGFVHTVMMYHQVLELDYHLFLKGLKTLLHKSGFFRIAIVIMKKRMWS